MATAGDVALTTNTAGTDNITITNTQGTAEDAIKLVATAGGVDIDAAAGKDVNISGGQLTMTSKTDEASAISMTTNQGSSETIVITNTQGTDPAAIALTSTAGGINMSSHAAGGKFIVMTGDVSMNNRLYVGQNALFDKDVTIEGNLNVQQYQSENIINTTTTNYQLLSLIHI